MENVKHTHEYLPGKGEVTVKIERGQRGGYGWEIKVSRPVTLGTLEDGRTVAAIIQQLDQELKTKFGGGE